MGDIAVVLGNLHPGPGEDAWEHFFPERSPRWLFAQVSVSAASRQQVRAPASTQTDALVLTASPLGPRIGPDADGPVALWIVLTNPAADREFEYNDWYDRRHIQDTLAIPGFVSARRYKATSIAGPQDARWAYLALYEIEPDRAAGALAEAAARAGGPRMPNPGMLAPGSAALLFRRIE